MVDSPIPCRLETTPVVPPKNSIRRFCGPTRRTSNWVVTEKVATKGLIPDGQLLSQGQILEGQVDLRNQHRSEKQHARFQEAHFRALGHRGNPRF